MNCRKLLSTSLLPLFLMFFSTAVWAQSKTISGRVVDAAGAGIPRVTVAAKGQNVATSSSETGDFTITIPANVTALVFSSVGYGTQEYTIGTNLNPTVTLSQVAGNLNEVVVVGYGTQRRRDVTGSVTTISVKDFNKGINTTPEQLIQGKVAGVQITSNGGAPGSGSVIRIRGGASLNASNDPLIVIDNVPVSNSGIAGSANVLNTINPNDIESFNILKDASATAIYGSRASNGVILITTKKGSRGDKLRVNYNVVGSIAKRTDQIDVLTGDEVRAFVNENGTAAQKSLLGSANTDWQSLIFREAYTHEHNLSISGGFKPLPYRLSVGYLNQDGILKTSHMDRTSASLGLFPSLFDKHLNITINGKATHTKNRFADEGAIGNAISFDPTQQPFQKAGGFAGYFEWIDSTSGKPNVQSNRNPLALLNLVRNVSWVNRFIGNAQFDYKFHFLPDLRANVNLGYDRQQGEGTRLVPAIAATQIIDASRVNGTGDIYDATNKNKLLEAYLNYTKNIEGINSRIDLTGGYSYQDFQYQNTNYPPYDVDGNLAVNATLPVFPINFNQQTLISYYGRLNYVLNEKYIVNATVRRDASSIFSKENRWGTFPAVSFAWRIKDEGFLKNSNLFSDLKLRVGYGVTGQQDITGSAGFYPYIPGYFTGDSSSMYSFGDTYYSTYSPKPYNADLKWEETETMNAGLDFGFFKGRLNGSLDVFRKTSRDLLATVAFPVTTNFSNEFIKNVGSFKADGIELTINATPVKTRTFTWDLGFNATYINREITKLNDVTPADFLGYPQGGIAGGTGNRIQVHSVGYTPNAFFVYQQVYNADNKPVEGLYVDQNGDGIINERDLYRYKSPQPSTTLGFNSQFGFKKVTLGFSLRSNLDNYLYSNLNAGQGVERSILNPLNFIGNGTRDLLTTGFNNNQYFSDYYVSNASFLKMDYLSLGVDLGKLGGTSSTVRLTANVQNVFTVTKYKGLDPENFSGIDNQLYPRPRIYSLGINLDY